MASYCLEGLAVGCQAVDRELEQALWSGQPFEAVLTEVDHVGIDDRLVLDDSCGCSGQQNLTAVPSRTDAGRTMHRDAGVSGLRAVRLSCVDPDADAEKALRFTQ